MENHLTSLNLESLWIANNLYEFGDLEPNFNTYKTNISDFWYSLSIKPDINLDGSNTVTIGNDRELSINTSGTNNIYTWYKGNTKLGESTDGKWSLKNIQIEDFGSYKCNITNSLVVNTTIDSNKILIYLFTQKFFTTTNINPHASRTFWFRSRYIMSISITIPI